MKGLFVAIEGVDGSGKTTAREYIIKALKAKGIDIVQTREPGGTPVAEVLREGLLFGFYGAKEEPLTPMTEVLLFNAARSQHIHQVIKPWMEKGSIVVSDRFSDSTLGHQGGGHGVPLEKLKAIHSIAHDDFAPDLTILLDGNPVVFRERMAVRGELDRLERNGLEWMQRSRMVHLNQAMDHPHRYFIINAENPMDYVEAQLDIAIDVIVEKYRDRQAA